MALDLNPETFRKLRQENSGEVMLELWRLTLESTPQVTVVLPLVGVSEPISYQGVTYWPFPLSRVGLPQDAEGTIQTASLTLSNIGRDFSEWLENDSGTLFLGQQARMIGVLYSELTLQLTAYEQLWEIAGASVDDRQLTFQLEASQLGSQDVPTDRYRRGGCRWRYRSQECGYEPDPNGDPKFLTCDYSLADCIERGDDEFARGMPRAHPNNFGAFPGLLRRVF